MRAFDVLVLILFGLLFILLSPITLLFVAYVYVRSLIDEWRFRRYLKANEGAKFFAYTYKASSKKYVEENILPSLSGDTIVFPLAGKKGRINMGDDFGLIAYFVSEMRKTEGGFPYVSRIVEGNLVTESINQRIYSAIRRGAGPEGALHQIEKFYSRTSVDADCVQERYVDSVQIKR